MFLSVHMFVCMCIIFCNVLLCLSTCTILVDVCMSFRKNSWALAADRWTSQYQSVLPSKSTPTDLMLGPLKILQIWVIRPFAWGVHYHSEELLLLMQLWCRKNAGQTAVLLSFLIQEIHKFCVLILKCIVMFVGQAHSSISYTLIELVYQ